jgi:hypothetical protein
MQGNNARIGNMRAKSWKDVDREISPANNQVTNTQPIADHLVNALE